MWPNRVKIDLIFVSDKNPWPCYDDVINAQKAILLMKKDNDYEIRFKGRGSNKIESKVFSNENNEKLYKILRQYNEIFTDHGTPLNKKSRDYTELINSVYEEVASEGGYTRLGKLRWFYNYSGLAFLGQKINPKEGNPTFFIWMLGIYAALFGLASQIYENQLDRWENRQSVLIAQLGTDARLQTFPALVELQKTKLPYEPSFLNPIATIFTIILRKQSLDAYNVERIANIITRFRANLNGAILDEASLVEANLEGGNLKGANLADADLRRADLRGAKLEGAFLWEANLEGADLQGANLEGADFKWARLDEAKLEGTRIAKASLYMASLKGAYLGNADLTEANLKGANLKGANLIQSNLKGAVLSSANLEEANLEGASLIGTDLKGAKLTKANLTWAFLYKANLEGANLEGANLENTTLERVKGLTCEQLTRAKNWEKSYRDGDLSCGAEIPPKPL